MNTRQTLRLRPMSLALVTGVVMATGTLRAIAQFVEKVDIIHEWLGEGPNDRMGRVVRWIGDVDGEHMARS